MAKVGKHYPSSFQSRRARTTRGALCAGVRVVSSSKSTGDAGFGIRRGRSGSRFKYQAYHCRKCENVRKRQLTEGMAGGWRRR